MANNYYKPKVWNAFCDSCGFKFKSDQLKLRWDGLMVDDACWEPRQPQDFLRAIKETSNILPWTRPKDLGPNIGPNYATLYIANDYFVTEPQNPLDQQTYFLEGIQPSSYSYTFPTIDDDNITEGDEGTSTSAWSITAGTGTITQQSSSVVRSTCTAGVGFQTTRTLTCPATNDYIFYLNLAGKYETGYYSRLELHAGVTQVLDIILGYNHETVSAELGTISSWDWDTSTGNNIATGIDYSVGQKLAIHVDTVFSCVNLFFLDQSTGLWDFRGSYPYNSDYSAIDNLNFVCSTATNYIEFDWLLFTRPNITAIGDSICAGHTLYDPDPSVYSGEDNYASTWMHWATLYSDLRNNIIVNKGVGAETSTQIYARINEATDCSPRVVFLHASTNDQTNGVSQNTRTTNIQNTIDSIVASGASAVLLNALYATETASDNTPSPLLRDYMLLWWNSYQPTITGAAVKIDIMQSILDGSFQSATLTQSDGLHPNVYGYRAIGQYILSYAY